MKIIEKTFIARHNKAITYYASDVENPSSIMHVIHGSLEHFNRWDKFINQMTKKKIKVYGMDIRGHGKTGIDEKNAYFAKKLGYQIVLEDINKLNKIIINENPNKKITLIGHSMGSFIARAYITKYNNIDALIAVGTNHANRTLVKTLKLFGKLFRMDAKKSSPIFNYFSYDVFNSKFKKENDKLAWLTDEKDFAKKFKEDNLMKKRVSNSGFFDIAEWILIFTDKSRHTNVFKKLPILLINGKNDPIGKFNKEVKKANKKYVKWGFNNVSHIAYTNLRHEILNIKNNKKVYEDIFNFIKTSF